MATAKSRGWGTGWPRCQNKEMIWVTAGGIDLLVRREIGLLVQGFVNEIVARGYPVVQVPDDWGFSCRPVRGTKYPSNHSWGLAIDINATRNPQSRVLVTDMPQWMPEVAAKWGFAWGGNYQTRPDAMHFEFMGTPSDARYIVGHVRSDDIPPSSLVYGNDLWIELKDYSELTPDTVTDACGVPDGVGAWRCTAGGKIIPSQGAPVIPDVSHVKLNAPITAIVPYSREGAWLIGGDGGIFACGNAPPIQPYLNIVGYICGANREADGALALIGSEGHGYYYPVP